MHYDYIIIGSGLAGLNFALNAAKKGRVLIVTKGKLHEGSTWLAQGGIAAVLDPSDSFKNHIRDTIVAGCGHNNRKTVEFVIKNAPRAIKKLQKLGIRFNQAKNGLPALNLEGGHSQNRIVHCGDHTGQSVEKALIEKVRAVGKITVAENVSAQSLLVKDKSCFGVRVIDKKNIRNILGRQTILATGGVGQVYERTTNPQIATGDGIAMAHLAGCRLKDMEFIQFHPTALKQGVSPYFLISETLRGHGAKLINQRGIRFTSRLHPLAELAPRDIVSRAIFEEEKRGKVFLDARAIDENEFRAKFPSIYSQLRALKINPANNPIPVTAVAHYSCGGIATDLKGRTNIKNLYAFGECACTGLHGANRLASNSLLEAMVLTENVPPANGGKINSQTFKKPSFKKGRSSLHIRKQIRRIMWTKVGIVRNNSGLRQALKQLGKLREKLPPATDRETSVTANMLTTAILISKAALKRKKSLGCHFIT